MSAMENLQLIRMTVNGQPHEIAVDCRRTLADVLRRDLGLTGTRLGCEHGICGACTVLVDGEPTRACLVLGVQLDDGAVETVEGLAADPVGAQVQSAFQLHRAYQCGFCTSGFLDARRVARPAFASPRRGRDTRDAGLESMPLHRIRADRRGDASGSQRGGTWVRTALINPSPAGVTDGDDPGVLTGNAFFVDDVERPGALAAAIVRSPAAHARLVGIDTSEALKRSGVRAVLTAADLDPVPHIPIRSFPRPGLDARRQPVLALDRVRYVGEPVAVVVADDPHVAEDSVEAVGLELDHLPPVVQVDDEDPAPLWDGLDNRICTWVAATAMSPRRLAWWRSPSRRHSEPVDVPAFRWRHAASWRSGQIMIRRSRSGARRSS